MQEGEVVLHTPQPGMMVEQATVSHCINRGVERLGGGGDVGGGATTGDADADADADGKCRWDWAVAPILWLCRDGSAKAAHVAMKAVHVHAYVPGGECFPHDFAFVFVL